MKMNISSANGMAIGGDMFGAEPIGHKRRRIPTGTIPRVRQKFSLCPVSGKRQLSQRAAELHVAAAATLQNTASEHLGQWAVKRAYKCPDCPDWHLTKRK